MVNVETRGRPSGADRRTRRRIDSDQVAVNMAESIQRILKGRALDGQEPTQPDQIIAWFEAVAARWNADPTPFEWGGRWAARRKRQRDRRHRVGGSGATTRRPVRRGNGYTRGN